MTYLQCIFSVSLHRVLITKFRSQVQQKHSLFVRTKLDALEEIAKKVAEELAAADGEGITTAVWVPWMEAKRKRESDAIKARLVYKYPVTRAGG